MARTREGTRRPGHPARPVGEQINTEIQALRAGELGIVTVPGELFSEYSAMLREVSPLRHTAVISLANDYIGYLLTDEALAQGAYESEHAPNEGLEQSLIETARKALAAVAGS